jgi:hypothetical protein
MLLMLLNVVKVLFWLRCQRGENSRLLLLLLLRKRFAHLVLLWW